MKIQNVNDAAFSKYGKVVTNVDFAPLVYSNLRYLQSFADIIY